MEKFLHDNTYAVTAPRLTLNSNGCVLNLNEAAAELVGTESVGQHFSNILCDTVACEYLLDESRTQGFASLHNQSLRGISGINSFQTSVNSETVRDEYRYNIFASLDQKQGPVSVFLCLNSECVNSDHDAVNKRAKLLAEKVKGQKLLQLAWSELFFSRDLRAGLDTLLPLIGKYLGVAKVRIFEVKNQSGEFIRSHQWSSAPEGLSDNPYDTVALTRLIPAFMYLVKQDGLLLAYDFKKLPSNIKRFLENSGAQSLLALPLNLDGKFHGIISCTNIKDNKPLSTYQIDSMLKISQIISLNMSRYYKASSKQYDIDTLQTIISHLDTCIGVVDKKTNKVLFANDSFAKSTDFSAMGVSCWNKIVVSNDADCTDCSLADKDFKGRMSKDVYLKSIQKWLRIIHEVMYWTDGVEHILFTAEDITAIKLDEQRLREGVSIDPVSGALSADTGIELLQKMLDSLNATGYGEKHTPKPGDTPFIAVLTLDHYATIQHSLGLREAITLLKKIGTRIRSELNVEELCRLSDNEFLIFPHKTEDPTLFARHLKDLLKNIQRSEPTDIGRYSMEASFAIAQAEDLEMLNAENLIQYARYKLANHKKEKTSRTNSILL